MEPLRELNGGSEGRRGKKIIEQRILKLLENLVGWFKKLFFLLIRYVLKPLPTGAHFGSKKKLYFKVIVLTSYNKKIVYFIIVSKDFSVAFEEKN